MPATNKKLTKKKSASASSVCRLIYDRHEVMETQIFNIILQNLSENLSEENLQAIKRNIHGAVVQHTNGLVDSISKQFL